jgi:serine/threonine-protein kinase
LNSLNDNPEGFVFGQYFLEKRLAHGGMAEVFLGRNLDKGKSAPYCVVKCILPDLASDPQFLAMFLNEAQLAAQMRHPNIVRVLDFGEQDGLLYMAMEYVEGLDCWRFNRRAFPFGKDHVSLALLIVQKLLDGLTYVHEMTDVNGMPLNVVHRDLSPSNIYLSVTGEVKLGDFGIAHIDSPRYRKISYVPRGKFGYVSPEQIEGSVVDARSDIFSVGIILAELLLGKKLFKGPSQLSVLLEIREGRFVTLEQERDHIEPALLDLLYRALSREPSDRFPTAIAFREELARYLGPRASTAEDLATEVAHAVMKGKGRETAQASDPASTLTEDQDKTPLTLISRPPPASSEPTSPSRVTPSVWHAGEEWDDLDFEDDETPITMDFDPSEKDWQYTVKLSDVETIGPISFAEIMELVCQDQIVSDTLVSLNGAPFKPADKYPELARHIPVYTPTLDVSDVQSPNRRGVLTVEAPAEIILSLALAEETGLLLCKQDKHRKEIYFRSGRPVYASSNTPSELLGEYLVSKGTIERADLDMALDVLPKFDGHMGDTLIALGMISAVDLFRSIAEQIKDRLRDLLSWRLGIYEFYRDFSGRKNAVEIPIDPYVFISECLVSQAETAAEKEVLTSMAGSVIDRTPAAANLLRRISFPEPFDAIVRDLLEPTKTGDLMATLKNNIDEKDIFKALFLALESGIWVVEGSALPWRS